MPQLHAPHPTDAATVDGFRRTQHLVRRGAAASAEAGWSAALLDPALVASLRSDAARAERSSAAREAEALRTAVARRYATA